VNGFHNYGKMVKESNISFIKRSISKVDNPQETEECMSISLLKSI